ncbi:hypothetical protein [Hydrogenophaga sp. 2FB]|uniref:hypothetical protein n=1 Tax=Hydrogenophaga sp. 2FB TaxID=2502187 RepID=UPI0010F52240|nr:hypothetical protein [Hydrogenophaga sp. 2FB]
MKLRTTLLLSALAALSACSSSPPAPEWQLNAKGGAERATEAWLVGDSRIEAAEFARVRHELTSTGRADLLARAELLRCATRVASLVFEPCTGFDALAQDAAPAEQAYARYLAGTATPADAALLPAAHRALVGGGAADAAVINAIQDPLSQLVAAGVLLRSGRASDAVAERAVGTSSARGWRRPLAAWLTLQHRRAQAAGAQEEAARLQRRIDLVLGPAAAR